MILGIFVLVFAVRLISLAISIRHEKRLIALGAREVGERTSKILAITHVLYYFAALAESYWRGVVFDGISLAGTVILFFALAMLFYVIRELGEIWTVKVYILPEHRLNRSWLFRHVRHPNYFLNIIPELVGVALLCHAWGVLMAGLPLYGAILWQRIREENAAMQPLWQASSAASPAPLRTT
ncbi:MAG: isoprenylcysteine carboxyl methyltransferase family protein [Cardiobacteriaceae bacterium]|nr:isoprenylcysteine carboxyl methyltransferase family protein [Cardiobacteriaceae bacterium]